MCASPSLRGFTLIELLVVIAIIGTLSSIVLSALNTSRNKGSDAAIKSTLVNARAQAELFYDANNNKYVVTPGGTTDACSSTGLVNNVKGIYSFAQSAAQSSGANLVTAINTTGAPLGSNVTCHACYQGQGSTNCTTQDRWAISAALKSTTAYNYCVDSTGWVGTTTDFLAAGDAQCN